MNIVNLTPHEVNLKNKTGSGVFTIVASGEVARVTITDEVVGVLDGQIEVHAPSFGEVIGLPEPKEGTIYIVSKMVSDAVPHRRDVYYPGKRLTARDETPVICDGLSQPKVQESLSELMEEVLDQAKADAWESAWSEADYQAAWDKIDELKFAIANTATTKLSS